MTEELEITPQRKEGFYTLMQAKMLDIIRQGEIYLNHAPRHEKYALCQRFREDMAALITEPCAYRFQG